MNVDLAGAATAALNRNGPSATDPLSVAVLKKAIDLQAQGALGLLQALPAPAVNRPPHLGRHIDTFA